jgi:hypothetical protein
MSRPAFIRRLVGTLVAFGLVGWAAVVATASRSARVAGAAPMQDALAQGFVDGALAFGAPAFFSCALLLTVTGSVGARRAAVMRGFTKIAAIIWAALVVVRLADAGVFYGAGLLGILAAPGVLRWARGRLLLVRVARERDGLAGLLVLSESERWNDFLAREWKLSGRGSLRVVAMGDSRLETTSMGLAFRHFVCAGRQISQRFVPAAIIFRGIGEPVVFSLRSPLTRARRGDRGALEASEAELSSEFPTEPLFRSSGSP